MTTKTVPKVEFKDFIRRQLELRETYPARFAKDLGVSHPTVGRWLTGEDIPKAKVCWRIAEVTGVPLWDLLKMAGHIPADYEPDQDLPAFRSYMSQKYPGVLADSVLRMVEREINANQT